MTKVLSTNAIDEVRPLISMSGEVATPELRINLLGFWKVRQERFVKVYILKDPSAVVPRRKVKLHTFA